MRNVLLKSLTTTLSAIGLGLTVVPAFLVFGGLLSWKTHAVLMAVGTVLWFASAPFVMKGASETTASRNPGDDR